MQRFSLLYANRGIHSNRLRGGKFSVSISHRLPPNSNHRNPRTSTLEHLHFVLWKTIIKTLLSFSINRVLQIVIDFDTRMIADRFFREWSWVVRSSDQSSCHTDKRSRCSPKFEKGVYEPLFSFFFHPEIIFCETSLVTYLN